MTDLVAQLVGALERVDAEWLSFWPLGPDVPSSSDRICAIAPETAEIWRAIRAALSAAKGGGWLDVGDCPDGDVWFALDCGHVVMGYKNGDFVDWESSVDHDCCHDASALKAQQVNAPKHPKDQS